MITMSHSQKVVTEALHDWLQANFVRHSVSAGCCARLGSTFEQMSQPFIPNLCLWC
jgi:hypothetical protein